MRRSVFAEMIPNADLSFHAGDICIHAIAENDCIEGKVKGLRSAMNCQFSFELQWKIIKTTFLPNAKPSKIRHFALDMTML